MAGRGQRKGLSLVELLRQALQRADKAIASLAPYDEVVKAFDAAEKLPGAREWAPGIASRRFNATLVYDRPVAEVEAAIRTALDIEADVTRRLDMAGAAYVTYAELRPYFEAELAVIEALPDSALKRESLAVAARMQAQATSRPKP